MAKWGGRNVSSTPVPSVLSSHFLSSLTGTSTVSEKWDWQGWLVAGQAWLSREEQAGVENYWVAFRIIIMKEIRGPQKDRLGQEHS